MGDRSSYIAIGPDDTIRTVLECLAKNIHGICVVLDGDEKILGVLTDGDCRRALIGESGSLDQKTATAMNKHFVAVDESFSIDQIKLLMRSNQIAQIPIVDSSQRFKDIVSLRAMREQIPDRRNPVLILAGGKGTRLKPLTDIMPKPMLNIGDKPMIEHLIQQLIEQHFTNIFISVNYLGHMIEEFFGDGSRYGCEIHYIHEEEALGTGGPLRLLETSDEDPVLLLNGDLVTDVDFGAFVDFHNAQKNDITLGVSMYQVQIPFGVIEVETGNRVLSIEEKPMRTFPINAGLYVLDGELKERIPPKILFPVTDLISMALEDGKQVGAFPIHESWEDVGMLDKYFSIHSKLIENE